MSGDNPGLPPLENELGSHDLNFGMGRSAADKNARPSPKNRSDVDRDGFGNEPLVTEIPLKDRFSDDAEMQILESHNMHRKVNLLDEIMMGSDDDVCSMGNLVQIGDKGLYNRDRNSFRERDRGVHSMYTSAAFGMGVFTSTDCASARCDHGFANVVRKLNSDRQVTLGVVDSGASHHMSPQLAHFAKLLDKYVTLKVADREVPEKAQYGIFKKNNLAMKIGLYCSSLFGFLVSVYRQHLAGNEVNFKNVNEIVNHETGTVHEFDWIDMLPRIEIRFEENALENPLVKEEIALAAAAAKSTTREKFLMHVRGCHFYCDCSGPIDCAACRMMKDHGGFSHKKERPLFAKSRKFLEQVNWDLSGPWPVSYSGKQWLLVAVDDYIKWIEGYALQTKDQVGEALKQFIETGPGRMERNRSDNASEFKGYNSHWRKLQRDYTDAWPAKPIKASYSEEYEPQSNGKAERTVRNFGNACRTVCFGVDEKCWDHAPQCVAHVWNRLDRKSGQKSPFYQVHQRDPKTKYFRRFGCLCYAKVHVLNKDKSTRNKMAVRYEPAIFLGYNANSTYKVGVVHRDSRTSTGWRFDVQENKTVKFDESRLVSDVQDLKLQGSYVPFALPDALRDSTFDDDDCGPSGSDPPGAVIQSTSQSSSSEVDAMVDADEDAVQREVSRVDSDVDVQMAPSSPSQVQQRLSATDVKPCDTAVSQSDVPVSVIRKPKAEIPQPDASNLPNAQEVKPVEVDPRVYVDADGVTRRRRGRLPGTKAKPHWKKTGPKGAKALKVFGDNSKDAIAKAEAERFLEEFFSTENDLSLEDGEVALSFVVQFTYKQCMESEDSAEWIEADNLERTKLTAKECWRNIIDEDGFDYKKDEVIPVVCIYTRKR